MVVRAWGWKYWPCGGQPSYVPRGYPISTFNGSENFNSGRRKTYQREGKRKRKNVIRQGVYYCTYACTKRATPGGGGRSPNIFSMSDEFSRSDTRVHSASLKPILSHYNLSNRCRVHSCSLIFTQESQRGTRSYSTPVAQMYSDSNLFTQTNPFSKAIHLAADRARGKTPFLKGTGHRLVEGATYPPVRVGFPKLHRPRNPGGRQ